MTPERVVRDFCRAVERRNIDELLDFFSDDAIYHNIPIAPLTGREAIGATLGQFLGPATRAEFEILALAVNGATVLTERVDRFEMGGKTITIPVMGAFEVTPAGKIRAWRDYFDMQQFTNQLG